MGMFDHVRVDASLPEVGIPVPPGVFQTKDFDCGMHTYVITAEGRLIRKMTRTEVVPKHERPYPDAPDDDMRSFIGSLRSVPIGDVDLKMHGDVCFYTMDDARNWFEFTARFTHGSLEWIKGRVEPHRKNPAGE